MKRLLHFLRAGHWPKKFRHPYGIPRTEYGHTVTTWKSNYPTWFLDGEKRVLRLEDGSLIYYVNGREHG